MDMFGMMNSMMENMVSDITHTVHTSCVCICILEMPPYLDLFVCKREHFCVFYKFMFEWFLLMHACVCVFYRIGSPVLHHVSRSPPPQSSRIAVTPEPRKCTSKPEKSEQHLEG